MKVSCLPVSLFPELINGSMTLGDWAVEAGRIGLDGIDATIAAIKGHSPVYLSQIKRMLEQMPAIMATSYPDFTNPDPVQRRRELDYFRADIALCSELGFQYLRILDGQAHPAIKREDGLKWAIASMRAADEAAKQYGVTLLFENHSKPSAWEYVDFSFPIDVFLELLEGLRGTGIRLNFDIGNVCALGLDPLEILPCVFDMVETIHVSDIQKLGEFAPVAIGTGVAPIGPVFRWLKARDFNGWLCIEECSNKGISGIAEAAAFIRKTWETA